MQTNVLKVHKFRISEFVICHGLYYKRGNIRIVLVRRTRKWSGFHSCRQGRGRVEL